MNLQDIASVDAIITDTERVQTFALGGEIFVALLIRVRIPLVVRPSTCDGVTGGTRQVLP